MPEIEISKEMLAFIREKAEPWVDQSEQDTIGRLIGFRAKMPLANDHSAVARSNSAASSPMHVRRKKPKVGLPQLLQKGYLRKGQKLYLIDYQNTKISSAEAKVGTRGLVWENAEYSMSELAVRLLKKAGYSSSSVRGPAHWVTDEGVTVLQLWQRYSSSDRA